MTEKQAIKIRSVFCNSIPQEELYTKLTDELATEMDNAITKQVPKKPIGDRYPWAICPACGGSVYLKNIQEHIQNNETTYCEHCGQALDWSDTDDR